MNSSGVVTYSTNVDDDGIIDTAPATPSSFSDETGVIHNDADNKDGRNDTIAPVAAHENIVSTNFLSSDIFDETSATAADSSFSSSSSLRNGKHFR